MGYAVIYDYWDGQDWMENFYEAFNTPEEATKAFLCVCHDREADFRNPRIVLIGDAIDPPKGKTWG